MLLREKASLFNLVEKSLTPNPFNSLYSPLRGSNIRAEGCEAQPATDIE